MDDIGQYKTPQIQSYTTTPYEMIDSTLEIYLTRKTTAINGRSPYVTGQDSAFLTDGFVIDTHRSNGAVLHIFKSTKLSKIYGPGLCPMHKNGPVPVCFCSVRRCNHRNDTWHRLAARPPASGGPSVVVKTPRKEPSVLAMNLDPAFLSWSGDPWVWKVHGMGKKR